MDGAPGKPSVEFYASREERRRPRRCLAFSAALLGVALVGLVLAAHFVVRYQVHGAWNFEPARCSVLGVQNTTLQLCPVSSQVCVEHSGSRCDVILTGTECIVIRLAVFPPGANSTGSSSPYDPAMYHEDVKALWDNPECSLRSPPCSSLRSDGPRFYGALRTWRRRRESGETFPCHVNAEQRQVLGRLRFTTTIAFLVILIPLLFAVAGGVIMTWSCFELLCCSPQALVERHREKRARRGRGKAAGGGGGSPPGPGGAAPRGRIGAQANRQKYAPLKVEGESDAMLTEESQT